MLGVAEDQSVTQTHYLAKIKVRERIANVQKAPRRKTRRWDVEKLLKDTAQTDKYQKALV